MAVERRQPRPDRIEIQQPVDPTQEMALRDVFLDPKPLKKVLLRLQPSHHRVILPADTASESAGRASIKAVVFH